jgi:hypothetical protein
MSLIVGTFRRDPDTGRVHHDDDPELNGQDLAGFESWRKKVWGSEAARRRGATFLPQLASGDLFVDRPELPLFAEECRRLLDDVVAFGAEVGANPDDLAFRLKNFLRAVNRAAPKVGGVVIW